MKAPLFKYCAPETSEEVISILHEYGDEAKILAGGQSLIPMLNMRLARPEVVIDITRIAPLQESHVTSDGCTYGTAVVHSSFEDGLLPDPTGGLLAAAAAGIGYRAVRNRGTLGGSLSHADSSAEWPILMAALNAELVCQSARGFRAIPAREFVLGFFTNALEDDELLTEVRVPALARGVRWGLHKIARKPGEFAESIAVVLVEETDGVILHADAWLGAAGDSPRRVESLDAQLRLGRLGELHKPEVLAAVANSLPKPKTDDERYRVHLHGMAVWRALRGIGDVV